MPPWPLIFPFSCSRRLPWRAVPWCLGRWTTVRLTDLLIRPRSMRRHRHPGSNILDRRRSPAMSGLTATGTGAVPAMSGCRGAGRLSARTRPGDRSHGSAKTTIGARMAIHGKSAGRRRKSGRASRNPIGAGVPRRLLPPATSSRHSPSQHRAARRLRSSSRPSRAGPASCAGWPSGLRPSAPIRRPGPPRLASVLRPSRAGAADAGGWRRAKRPTGIDIYHEKIAVAG